MTGTVRVIQHRCAALALAAAACSGPETPMARDAGAPDTMLVPDAPEVLEDLETICGAVPVTLADWEACYVKRYCETHAYCGEHNLYADAQECIAQLDAVNGGRLAFEAFERERAIEAGRAALDVEAFTQCLRGLSPARCLAPTWIPACAARFVGTVPDGESCHSDVECMSPGARCETQSCEDSCCAGTCQPRARLGEPCMAFDACEPGLVCSLNTFTCVPGDVGTACADHDDCDFDAWCDEGICKADLGEGAPCTSILQCGGGTSCVGLRREAEPPRCRRVTEAGDTCDWYCLGNHYCDLSSPRGFGVCRSLPGLGEPCGAFAECIGRDLYCAQGTCTVRPDVGEPCSGSICQPGTFCTDQLGASSPVCRDRMEDGAQGCNRPAQCDSYVCDGDVSAPGGCQPLQRTCP